MIEIKNCPSTLAEGFDTYSPHALKSLFNGTKVSPYLDFGIAGLKKTSGSDNTAGRISVSGVQEKFSAVIDHGIIRLAQDGERSTHILKPAPWDETIASRRHIPANEHLTMQIASQVYGILTAANGLCISKDGQLVYITRRFDISPNGTKTEMEDFASALGKSEQAEGSYFKYTGSYEEIATCIRKNISAWMIDTERLLDLITFNYIYGNGDDHLKNFSLIRQGEDYRLAPAYDLINTNLHVRGDDFGLDGGLSPNIFPSDVYEKTGHPCRTDFERFGKRIGIVPKRLTKILDRYSFLPEQTATLISRSYLPDKMRRIYIRTVKERIMRFCRESE